MKIAATMAAMALLLGMSNIAKAQEPDGHPFAYTITGDFVDGEPNATYTAFGGIAFVQVGVAALFDVLNKDTRTRQASPSYSADASLYTPGGRIILPSGGPLGADGSDNLDIGAGKTVHYSLNFLTSGNVAIGTYFANADFYIEDGKTGDSRHTVKTKNVAVQ